MAESHDADAFSFPRMSCELSMLGGIDAFPGFGSAEVLREGSDVVAALPRMSAMMAASIPRESRMSLGYLQLSDALAMGITRTSVGNAMEVLTTLAPRQSAEIMARLMAFHEQDSQDATNIVTEQGLEDWLRQVDEGLDFGAAASPGLDFGAQSPTHFDTLGTEPFAPSPVGGAFLPGTPGASTAGIVSPSAGNHFQFPPMPDQNTGQIKFPSFGSMAAAATPTFGSAPTTPSSAPPQPAGTGNSAEVDKRLRQIFPKEILRENRHNFQKFKLQITNLDLSPFETDRLRKLRRKELSCVYASRQREKAKAKEREKQQAHG